MVRELNHSDHVSILDGCANLQRYLKKGNHNRVLYRSVDKKANARFRRAIKDAVELRELCRRKYDSCQEWKLLNRVICEQTARKGGKYILREGKDILPESLQNPADPDATYRFKLKAFKGYVVYVVAAVR